MADNNKIFGLATSELLLVGIGGYLAYRGIKKVIDNTGGSLGFNSQENIDAGNKYDAWNPKFWQAAPKGALLITSAAADKMAADVYSYCRGWNIFDNYAIVINTFKKLKTQSQVSYLCYVFSNKYNRNLYNYLREPFNDFNAPWDGLSNAHLTELNNYVTGLPKYFA